MIKERGFREGCLFVIRTDWLICSGASIHQYVSDTYRQNQYANVIAIFRSRYLISSRMAVVWRANWLKAYDIPTGSFLKIDRRRPQPPVEVSMGSIIWYSLRLMYSLSQALHFSPKGFSPGFLRRWLRTKPMEIHPVDIGITTGQARNRDKTM